MSNTKTFKLDTTYVQLHDGPAATPISVDPHFWDRIQERKELHEGRLLIVTHQTGAMTHWEMHPAGDELLYLLSGNIDLILEAHDSDEVVNLRPGTAVIVPQGTWHTLTVNEPGDLLSITRGAGTQVRATNN